MINSRAFLGTLQTAGIHFYAGVPDSLLKAFCACLSDHVESKFHIITGNEGGAVALATGYHLATGRVPLVYMQNSGFGNCINPLLSLADPEVYSIPMLLLVGWRGEPGLPDEPQHVKQGRVQGKLFDAMEIPWAIIGPETNDYEMIICESIARAESENRPVALVVSQGTFEPYNSTREDHDMPVLTREEALEVLLHSLGERDIVVSTTGMISREVFEIRAAAHMGHHRDFLTVGSMGHCSQIALGIALEKKSRQVYCIDGDGSMLMHMGSLAITGNMQPENFRHVVINNGAHDSVGGQPTAGFSIDIPAIATACGYRDSRCVHDRATLTKGMDWLKKSVGPLLMEVCVKKGARNDLGRPDRKPVENKKQFMDYLS